MKRREGKKRLQTGAAYGIIPKASCEAAATPQRRF
nr:MAG TPA: hypothetical protein [Caudoviricetes sp.]